MGFEPMNSYKNGFLLRVWRHLLDLESIAVDRAWLSRHSTLPFHLHYKAVSVLLQLSTQNMSRLSDQFHGQIGRVCIVLSSSNKKVNRAL